MKRIIIALASIATLSSCTSREEIISGLTDNPTQKTDSVFTYTMTMNDDAKPSDAEVGTRVSSSGVWEDNDTIQIFFGGVNSAYAQGVYHLSSNSWTVSSAKSLQETNNSVCSIAYYKGVGMTQTDDGWRHYDYMTDWYSTDEGQYSITNGSIHVSATLKRPYWRLRFEGVPGTVIRVDSTGIMRVAASKQLTSELNNTFFTLIVNDNGYTDYFIGETDVECTKIGITDKLTDHCFYRYFDDHTLKPGDSGCFSIPEQDTDFGWVSKEHDYVDLGLPSGLLWATRNIGADYPYEQGWLFAWGETEVKDVYNAQNYKFFDYYERGSRYRATKYNSSDNETLFPSDDAAVLHWGQPWRLPTKIEVEELRDNCVLKQVSETVYALKSKINGNIIYVTTLGNWTSTSIESMVFSGTMGVYYTYYDNSCCFNVLTTYKCLGVGDEYRHVGLGIRPVKY